MKLASFLPSLHVPEYFSLGNIQAAIVQIFQRLLRIIKKLTSFPAKRSVIWCVRARYAAHSIFAFLK